MIFVSKLFLSFEGGKGVFPGRVILVNVSLQNNKR